MIKSTSQLLNSKANRAKRLAIFLSFSSLIAACSTAPIDMRPAAKVFNDAPVQNRPVTRPLRAISSFTESLACMDRMLRDEGVGTTLITSKDIEDPTGKASVATKEMIITSLSQMSRISNTFRFVDYEIDLVRQDTVQNLTGILLNANKIQLQRPALYISGAVAYVDQGIFSTGEQAGSSASRLELGYSADRNATLIGMEFHLGDFQSRTLIPGIDSANDIIFGSRGQGLDAAARIGRYGVQFNMSRTTSMGAGAAVRTLVDLAMIELIGKWARVPYWQCLMLDRTNPAFERQFKDWFDALAPTGINPLGVAAPGRRVVHAKRALKAEGYFDGELTEGQSSEFKQALARYQSDHGLVPSGDLTFPTFEHLFRSYVRMNDNGILEQVGWGDIPVNKKPEVDMKLAIANQKFIPNEFVSGESVFLTASASRESYLYCFYQDARGQVSRLFPNPFQRESAIPGNRVVRIPDWLVLNPGFALRAGTPGSESVSCHVSESDIFAQLPEALRATAILPMRGVPSLAAVDTVFAELGKKQSITSSNVKWTVKPQPAKISQVPAKKPNATVGSAGLSKMSHGASGGKKKSRVHEVQPRDTLEAIARQYDVSISHLMKTNRLCSKNFLRIGQKLYVDEPTGVKIVRRNCSLLKAKLIAPSKKNESLICKDPGKDEPDSDLKLTSYSGPGY